MAREMSLTDEDKQWISKRLEEAEVRMTCALRYFSHMYSCPYCRQQFNAPDMRDHLSGCSKRAKAKV